MKAYERLLKYVAFDTTSADDKDFVPSTEHQFELAKYLKKEMEDLGLQNVELDEHCYVYGTLPANDNGEHAHIGFIAHMDTSNAVSGADIKPRIIRYEGGDIKLSETVSTTVKTFPHMENYVGHDLIVTDGTTLLGADDKAGIAEILTMVEYLQAHPEVKHGEVSVAFTPDEEVGNGTMEFRIPRFGAAYAYTCDGSEIGGIEYECFNAAGAQVVIHGVNVHPGSSKNVMKNAVLMASEFIQMLPPAETPAHTEGYEGFYHVSDISGNETEVTLRMILRDHSGEIIEKRKAFVQKVGDFLNDKYGEGTVEVHVKDSYRNMREIIGEHMEVVDKAIEAMKELGITPVISPIRGGTDGAQLTFKGLLCPNLGTGCDNFHGVNEFASIQDMDKATDLLITLVKNA